MVTVGREGWSRVVSTTPGVRHVAGLGDKLEVWRDGPGRGKILSRPICVGVMDDGSLLLHCDPDQMRLASCPHTYHVRRFTPTDGFVRNMTRIAEVRDCFVD